MIRSKETKVKNAINDVELKLERFLFVAILANPAGESSNDDITRSLNPKPSSPGGSCQERVFSIMSLCFILGLGGSGKEKVGAKLKRCTGKKKKKKTK
ncbi:hypothetical protein HI914_06418 [Erysiphe necator]|nr:hypothetical protein HI914_06418 [Erysiphe necator]